MRARLPVFALASVLMLLAGHAASAGNCSRKVSASDVIVFVDTNGSSKEIAAAREAACLRGQGFELVPSHSPKDQRSLDAAQKARMVIMEAYDKACFPENGGQFDSPKCKAAELKGKEVFAETEKVIRALSLGKEKLTKDLKALAAGNKVIRSLVISGHDGGGQFSGVTGGVSKEELFSVLGDAYKGKEKLLTEIDSAHLLGCYTATPAEVLLWKSNLPSLKVVSGFYGSGPLNGRPASYQSLKDSLVKVDRLVHAKNEREVGQMIRGISKLNSTFAGVYVKTCEKCGNTEYYFSISEKDRKFGTLDRVLDCSAIREAVSNSYALVREYLEGTKEIPNETSRGPLRELYSMIRQNAQCFEKSDIGRVVSGDRVGLLLFFKNVKKNFADVFAEQVQGSNAELATVERGAGEAAQKMLEKIAAEEAELSKSEAKRKAYLEAELKKLRQSACYGSYPHFRGRMDNIKKELENSPEQLDIIKRLESGEPGLSEKLYVAAPSTREDFLIRDYLKYYPFVRDAEQKMAPIEEELTRNLSSPEGVAKVFAPARLQIQNALADFQAKVFEFKRDYWAPDASTLPGKSRAEINKNISRLESLASHPLVFGNPPVQEKLKNTLLLHHSMQTYLYSLDPACMEFDEWHDHKPGVLPRALCSKAEGASNLPAGTGSTF